MTGNYSYIYLLCGPLLFPADAADLADSYSAIPRAVSVGQRYRPRVHMKTRDHLQFGQEDHLLHSSKYLNSYTDVSSHRCHTTLSSSKISVL